jgi:GNAT superfamily N-acetyltransferase
MREPIRQLFAEFAEGGGADLGSREFLMELLGLPGEFEPPSGRLIAALGAGHLAGCGALRDAGAGGCEIRRVFVREEYRNAGVELRILMALLHEAQEIGYERAYVDPSSSMRGFEAHSREAGFDAPGDLAVSSDVEGMLALDL